MSGRARGQKEVGICLISGRIRGRGAGRIGLDEGVSGVWYLWGIRFVTRHTASTDALSLSVVTCVSKSEIMRPISSSHPA